MNIFNFLFPNKYEGKALLNTYIRSQYGPFLLQKPYYGSEPFYQAIIAEAQPYLHPDTSACDVGCALGRLTYEWARIAKHSVGIDASKAFIEFCISLPYNESLRFLPTRTREPEFINADVLTHPFKEGHFEFMSCINVVDRVKNPQLLIDTLYKVLAPGGTMILADPYDWALSPAPARLRVPNMRQLLTGDAWHIKKEMYLDYTIPIDTSQERTYECHVLVVQK